ncbi:12404_t:CDS:2 [Ambispora gerdemannii]|uniref:12404_t:CDS:1 n=1 Tax=Ambispora gerdemannii TaxID=144530 RepID=A0A9N9H1J6_9GLOM|nr:12404_t:CDS:2 [Ambispora gerdemannii]
MNSEVTSEVTMEVTSEVTMEVTSEVTREVTSLPNRQSHIGEIAITTLKATITVGETIGEMLPFAAAACKLANQIIEMVESAQRHKELCKKLSGRIQKATIRIKENHPTKDASLAIQVSYQNYKQILEEAVKYIRDLIKPGTFSQRTLKRFKSFLGSKDMLEYHDDLARRLDAAIQELQLDCILDTNKKVTCMKGKMDEIDSNIEKVISVKDTVEKLGSDTEKVLAQLAMLTKGAKFGRSRIYIDQSRVIDDGDDTEIKGKNKNIKKMLFDGCVAVAVYKVPTRDNVDNVQAERQKNIDYVHAERQAMILKELSACENIENFQGLMKKDEELYVVTRWAANYDLEKYLRSDIEILWEQKLKFAEGIAAALKFCHENDIFHHDVKSANVLLDEHLNVKLSNFGMARFFDDITTSVTGQMKSIRWTTPEKLKNPCVPYSKEMDVYGFGIVMWEIAARKEPFYQIEIDINVPDMIKNGERPSPIPNDIIPEYEEIMKWSWVEAFHRRPTMYQISCELHGLCKKYKSPFQGNGSNTSLSTTLSEIKKFDFKAQINEDEPVKPHTRPAWKDVTMALTNKNYKEAIERLELYAQSDAKEANLAKYYAGKLLYEGHHGVTKDEFKALVYLSEAAEKLPVSSFSEFAPMAQYLYADLCLKGERYDRENGIKYLEMAVKASEKNALFLFGTILWNGEHGFQIDTVKAREMFKSSKSRKAREMLKIIEAEKKTTA